MDIRNFFGGNVKKGKSDNNNNNNNKKKEKKEEESDKQQSKVKNKKEKKKTIQVEEDLEDSDFEEEDKREVVPGTGKRRLRTKKEQDAAKKLKKSSSTASPARSSSRKVIDIEKEEEVVKKEEKQEVIPPEMTSTTTSSSSKSVKRKQEASPVKNLKRKEVVGGAGAFFGISSTSSTSSEKKGDKKSNEEALKTTESTPTKVTSTAHRSPQSRGTPKRQKRDKSNVEEVSGKTVLEIKAEKEETKKKRMKTTESLSTSVETPAPGLALKQLKEFFANDKDRYPSCGLKQRVEDIVRIGSSVKSSQCLTNLKVAFTGMMEKYIARDSLQDLYLSHGAKVTASVSGNTHFLLAADDSLEDGRPVTSSRKYQEAMERQIPILDEKGAVSLLLYAIDTTNSTTHVGSSKDTSKSKESTMSSARAKVIGSAYEVGKAVKKESTIEAKRHQNVPRSGEEESKASSAKSMKTKKEASELLWVDKYKPTRLEDVIGGTENIKKMVDWLKRWDAVHIKKSQKVAFTKENPGARAVLISGPPGIGKSTLATLIASTMGYEVVELNASDARNKKAVEEQLKDVVMSRAISSTGTVKRRLVVMDEVDGMGGSDRGGIPELIKVIKVSKNPIICICNDRQCMKIRSLSNHCYDIRLRRPTKSAVAHRIIQIGRQEGLMIESNAAELLVEQMGNDIRQCINAAQMWKAQSNVMRYSDLRAPPPSSYQAGGNSTGSGSSDDGGRLKSIEKDKILRQSPFDACGLILGGSKNDFFERYNSFFIDYSLLPLLVQQNYLDCSQSGIMRLPGKDAADKLELLSQASDAVSEMELLGAQVRGGDQHWELLPAQAALSMKVGSIVQGYQSFPTFPQWLGKNSTTSKSKRLTQELVVHTLLRAGQGFQSMRLEYNCYLKHILLKILKEYGTSDMPAREDGSVVSGVRAVIDILDSYGLSRDDLMETMQGLQFVVPKEPLLQDPYAFLDSKLKTALTREYNSMVHTSQALVENLDVKKKRRRAVDDVDDEEGTIEDLGAAKEVEDVDSDAELEAFLKKHANKGKGKGSKSSGKKKGATSKKKK